MHVHFSITDPHLVYKATHQHQLLQDRLFLRSLVTPLFTSQHGPSLPSLFPLIEICSILFVIGCECFWLL